MAALWLSGCGVPVTAGTVTPDGFQSGSELSAALQAAGAQTSTTDKTSVSFFGASGQVWQVGPAEVQVFSYPSTAEREKVSLTIPPDAHSVSGQAVDWADKPNIWATGRLIVVYVGTDGGTILLLSGLMGDPLTQPAGAQGGPYPPSVAAAIVAVAQEDQVDPGAIDVVSYEAAHWPDTCLGLPKPGEACAQHVTSGWRIQLRVNGQTVVMRSDDVGAILRREAGS
jgi:hypothetical protein